jgi:glycogen phosphorylase
MIGNLLDPKEIKLRRIFVEPKLPAQLEPLQELAHNIWWSWNIEATELFQSIAGERWHSLNYNPIAVLEEVSLGNAQALAADKEFLKKMDRVISNFNSYIAETKNKKGPSIAYFCMEYGLHISLRLYSGGLGVLAGDYIKEASDRNSNLVAVGLLYRYGYFQQGISINGEQIHNLDASKFTQLPLTPVKNKNGSWIIIPIPFPERTVHAKIWELKVGRVSLYLLDTDIDENNWEDRSITHQLYGGDNEHRLKQEMVLGLGGVKALKEMGIEPSIFHCNEGHAAFLTLERLKDLVKEQKLDFPEAMEVVRSSSIYTCHTPVPAGHDHFAETTLKKYISYLTQEIGVSWDQIMALGKLNRYDETELFSMSNLAIRLCNGVNGVSMLHGKVSQKMFNPLFPDYTPEELYITYVTNSVHYPTWTAKEWQDLYLKTFGKDFEEKSSEEKTWEKIYKTPDETIISIRKKLKSKLLQFVKENLEKDLTKRGENPRIISDMTRHLDENALVLGFARRFATYKRAQLLFSNPERLASIVNDSERPVIFLFSGKAHPADKGGQELIRNIYNMSKLPQFIGKIIFLENYSMESAKFLVQGVDIWLNNPTRPQEASGTSGMKAIMNGVMNFSVLDGWWLEGYRADAGWALPLENTYEDPSLQNELDAESMYNILENEIIPQFFELGIGEFSPNWVQKIKNTIAKIAPQFTMQRMLDQYYETFYNPQAARAQKFTENHFQISKDVANWKNQVRRRWNAIQLKHADLPDTRNTSLSLGQSFKATLEMDLNGLHDHEVGIEVVFFKRKNEKELELVLTHEMAAEKMESPMVKFHLNFQPGLPGVYEFGFRMFPKHPMLANRQDFNLVTWVN